MVRPTLPPVTPTALSAPGPLPHRQLPPTAEMPTGGLVGHPASFSRRAAAPKALPAPSRTKQALVLQQGELVWLVWAGAGAGALGRTAEEDTGGKGLLSCAQPGL
eukprot:scaffold111503_cov18-Tisochrysis_lutea.AAC.2